MIRQKPLSQALLDISTMYDTNQLCCPMCSYDYVHCESPIEKLSDSYEAWAGRGKCTYIPGWCEGGHRWEIGIGFHKGNSYAFIQYDDEQAVDDTYLE